MTRMADVLHPTFDELSAYADRQDIGAERTRIGRHVARCATCSGTVAEIRALGASARESRVPPMPSGLWARMEQQMDEGEARVAPADERVVVLSVSDEGGSSSVPNGRSSTAKLMTRTVLGLVALFAVAAAVVAIDADRPLEAASPGRLRADREAARPGHPIMLRYRPIPSLATHPTLTAWMWVPGRNEQRYDQLLTRAGTLHRVSALEYTGSVTMPDSSPVVMFVMGDSTGGMIDRTELRSGRLPAAVLAADSAGRPTLGAFIAALGNGPGSADQRVLGQWAAQMREIYPAAPETWIIGDRYRRRTVLDDIVKIFESRERRYYGWHDRLERRSGLSATTETMMANIGWELMDTARADFWVTRLLHDHPDSPFAASLWIRRYRDVPADSVAPVLRAFEPIYSRADSSLEALQAATALAQRSGDSALIRRWRLRADPRGYAWLLGGDFAALAGNPAARADVLRRLRAALAETDREARSGPTLRGRSQIFAWYTHQRLRTRLAAVQLVGGNAGGAKAAFDSIVHEAEVRPTCAAPETMRWRAEAARRLGLMAEARSDLAYVATTENWQLQMVRDSVPGLLGGFFSKASWDSAMMEGKAAHQRCWVASRDARRRGGG